MAASQFLVDGYQTLISIQSAIVVGGLPVIVPNLLVPDLSILVREREVTPPPVEGGGSIDTTTMRNVGFRTMWHKSLQTLGPMKLHCQYKPSAYAALITYYINSNGLVTVQFPDLSKVQFFGFMDKYAPPSHKEGDFPVAELDIIPTLRDNSDAIWAPWFTNPPGP